MKRSLALDIVKIALPLTAAFTLLIACSDSHPAAATNAEPATTRAPAATTTPSPEATHTASSAAKAPSIKVNLPSDLLAKAKVSLIQALATARLKVPGSRPVSEELEQENGKLIYTFDLVAPGASRVTEVNVDALDGSLVAMHQESASTEKQEKKEDKATRSPR